MRHEMQYFKPEGLRFVGDCMPFAHDGLFHLFYLIDENHHQGRGGLGGHQWAHVSTPDLVHWEHHPLALAVEEEWEGSICTGSVFHHDGLFHAYYATRKPDWSQHLSHAVSTDGIRFVKSRPLPLAPTPPGYDPLHFRDPFVFVAEANEVDEAGRFQMLVTARWADFALPERGGCLLRLSSHNLMEWQPEGPLLIPGGLEGHIPECADYFIWNGWHYLVFGLGLATHYRMAHNLNGPWLRPAQPLLDSRLMAVMKTAPFGADRRIGAAWIGTREGDRDSGGIQWGGNLVLRELVQHTDGTLSTRFVPELAARQEVSLFPELSPLTSGVEGALSSFRLHAPNGQAVAALDGLPQDFHLRCRIVPQGDNARFGLGLRGEGVFQSFYPLIFEPGAETVTLANERLTGVPEIWEPFDLDLICSGDIIDLCIADARCLINRLPAKHGNRLFCFCEEGAVEFQQMVISG